MAYYPFFFIFASQKFYSYRGLTFLIPFQIACYLFKSVHYLMRKIFLALI